MSDALGPYRIGEQLGELTIGPLFAATREGGTEALAVADVREVLRADHRFGSLLRLEVARARSVTAPGLVRLVEVVDRDGRLAVAMDRPPGLRLDLWRTPGAALGADRVVGICRQVAAGLAEGHRRGVVHGALAPDQVWIDDAGHVTLVGLGLLATVEQAAGDTTFSRTDWLSFVAPEAVGDARAAASMDGYALGALTFWLFTGVEPFGGDSTPPPPYAQVELEPPSVRAARPDLAVETDSVLRRQLARNPTERFTTPAAFADALAASVAT